MAEDEESVKRVVKKRVVKKAAPSSATTGQDTRAEQPDTVRTTKPPTPKVGTPKARATKAGTPKARTARTRTPRRPKVPGETPEATTSTSRRRPLVPTGVPALPEVPRHPALALSGATAGLVAVGLTTALMALFDLLRGTSTGGGAWGLLGVVVVLALSVGAGTFLLSSLHVPQAGLTAGVGALLVVIVVLAALLGVVYSGWMWLVIPALTALAYLATHWVLSRTEG